MFRYIIAIAFAMLLGSLLLFYWPIAFGLLSIVGLISIGFINLTWLMLIVGILLIIQPLLAFLRIPFWGQLDEFLLLLSFLCVFFRKLLVNRGQLTRTPIDIWLLFLLLAGAISSFIYHIVPLSITLGGLALFCKCFLFFYIFANVPMQIRDLDLMMKTFLILGIVIAVYGILGAVAPSIFLSPLGIVNENSSFTIPAFQSFLGHPGEFAAFMAMLGVFTFSQYWLTGQKQFLLLNIFFVICMILSFRRTSVAGYFLALLIVILGKGLPKPAISVNRKIAIFGVIFFIISFSGVLTKMYNNLYQEYFLSGDTPRSLLLKTGVRVAIEHFPLGAGFGTFGSGINRSFYSPLFYKYDLFTTWGLSEDKLSFTNDTFWPHILAETGVIGFIFYWVILFIILGMMMRILKLTNSHKWRAFALGTFMMFILSVVESSKGTFYEETLWAYLYFGGIGICMNWFSKNKQNVSKIS